MAEKLAVQAAHHLITFDSAAMPTVDEALALDSECVLAVCLKAYVNSVNMSTESGKFLRRVETLQQKADLSPVHTAHLDAVHMVMDGRLRQAAAAYTAILRENPRDLVATKIVYDLHFYLGNAKELHDSMAVLLDAWPREDRLYGHLLGMVAFGLEEMRQLDDAKRLALEAVALEPTNTWAVHTVVHCYEENDEPQAGLEYSRATQSDWDESALAIHHHWHQALFHLALGSMDDVLATYDKYIAFLDDDAPERFRLSDAASLLWRLELRGVDVGDRFARLVDKCRALVTDRLMAFNDVHAAILVANHASVERVTSEALQAALFRSMDDFCASTDDAAVDTVHIARVFSRPLCTALVAFGRGDYAQALDVLFPMRLEVHRIGGSGAQRDVVTRTIVETARRANDRAKLEQLVQEYLALRPNCTHIKALLDQQ